ncbi:MAG: translation initiation factor, partial [Synergistaceae bacterium]|nr:translation initiation factor [Synergistaceae bacterium]
QKTDRISVDEDSLPLGLSLGELLGRNIPQRTDPPEEKAPLPEPAPPARALPGRVILARETRGRGGKTVTSLTFREGDPSDPTGLARSLRTDLGCGGVYEEEEGRILLQGDQIERAAEWFTRRGAKVTRGTA